MGKTFLKEVSELIQDKKRSRNRRRIVVALSLVVAFATSWLLAGTAITMESASGYAAVNGAMSTEEITGAGVVVSGEAVTSGEAVSKVPGKAVTGAACSYLGEDVSGPGDSTQPAQPQETSREAVVGKPVAGIAALLPAAGVAAVQPVTGVAAVLPVTGVAAVQPLTGEAATQPVTGATVQPSGNLPVTRKVKIIKVDEFTGEVLGGARFTLAEKIDDIFVDMEGKTWITVPESGYDLGELEAGVYRLEELEAPGGYIIIDDPLEFEVSEEGLRILNEVYNVEMDSEGDTDIIRVYNMKNNNLRLPSTGGTGTTAYVVVGLVLMMSAAAGACVIRNKKYDK